MQEVMLCDFQSKVIYNHTSSTPTLGTLIFRTQLISMTKLISPAKFEDRYFGQKIQLRAGIIVYARGSLWDYPAPVTVWLELHEWLWSRNWLPEPSPPSESCEIVINSHCCCIPLSSELWWFLLTHYNLVTVQQI